MNTESVRKLLCSESTDDNLLALNILRGRNANNWGGFMISLEELCHGYYYTVYIERCSLLWDRGKREYKWVDGTEQRHLWDKYFDMSDNGMLKRHWYGKVD